MKTGTNKKSLSLILASLLCVALTVFGIGNLSVFKNRQAKAAAGSAVAKVGEIEYADLNDAFAALGDANSSLELLDDAAWDETTPVYWKTNGGSGYAATFAAALTASYMSDGGAITIVCRPGADVGYMTHGHVEDDLTVYGNGAYISDGECDIEVDTFPYSRTTGKQVNSGSYLSDDVTITAYKLGNLGVWGQRNTNYTVNVNLYDCDGKAIDGKTNVQRVYISGKTGVNNFNIVGCDFLTAATSLYSNADGKIVISDCSFTGSQVPVNFNHKTNGDMSLTVENCTFDSCGDKGDWKAFAAPVRFVNSADGTMGATVDGCTFVNTVGNNGDVLVGDGREGQSSNDVAVSVKNTEANVTVQQPGYYDASGNVASDDKAETTVTVSDTPYIAGDNYTTIELIYGDNVAEEDIVAAKKLYEGVAYSTNKAANEAYMALFGVTWGKGYLDVTDNSAPLYKYAGVSGSVMEVKYYVHGVMPGFTSLQSNGNNMDCTVGGNHQIARTSYSIIGINDENNNKAQITNGNVQAYVAGGYDRLFTSAGTLKIKNIEFTSKTSTTVGASATIATEGSTNSVTFAEMIIEDCVFRGRLYVYDNFENQGKMTYTIRNCTFDGTNYSGDSNAYAIFAQCKGGNRLFITGNKISGYARGINIDHANIKAEISENTISVTDTGRSCVQLSSLSSAKVTDNNLNLTGGNAITLHEKLLTMTTVPEITFEKNNVTGKGYLVYDDAAANNKAFTSENLVFSCNANTVAETVDTENGVKDGKKTAVSDVVNGEIHFFKDADSVWHINNGQGLAKFAASVTKTNTYKGETVKLDCDIDMTGVAYTSAGNGYLTGFGGTFDGCEHTISNLSITESGNYSGLFYVLTGTVKNLNIINANVQGVRAAVLAGASYSCTIEHVTISNSVVTGEQKCAGLLGFQMENSTLDISDCKVENVEIKAASTKYSDVQGASFGGLVGFIHRDVKATITNNTVKNISFEGLLGEDFYAEHSIVYYQYLSHPFIGALIGTSNNGEYDSCETVLSGNKVEDSLDGLISGPTTNGFLGFYYRSDFSAKNVTKIVIDDNVVANNVVVHIGDAYYASFEDALAAAVDGDTITLLEDITVTGKQVVIDKKITIDLNGKTLKVSGYTAQKEQINVTGELTVKDSAEGGLICSDYTGTSGLIVNVANGGKFTLESGTITTEGMANSGNAVKIATGGEFVMNGGTVKADAKRGNRAVNVTGGKTGSAKFTMNGGSIIADDPTGKETPIYGIVGGWYSVIGINGGSVNAFAAIEAKDSTMSVTGGEFKGTIVVKSGSISGGTFDSALDYKYLADGYVLEDKGDGTYGLKEGKYIAGIDTVGYESLQAAVNAAGENAIIKLVADTTENVTIEAGKNITLNLNGFTLSGGTGTAKAAILNYGTVVIKDSTNSTGTIKREDNGTVGETSYYVILNLGTMMIESGTITNNSGYEKANSSGEMVGSSLICNGDDDPGATLYVKGGKLTQLNFIAIKNGALGNLYVTGGEITSEHSAIQNWFNASITGGTISGQLWTDAWKEGESVGNTEIGGDANFTGEIVMDITGSVVPKLNITGGTIDVTNWRITDDCANAGGKPQVSGGTFASAVDESYCESGFIPTENEDGTYGVKEGKFLVRIDGKGYETLAEAIEAAADGDTLTILEDIEVSDQIVIEKAITIDLGGNTISNAYSGNGYSLVTKADVTIKNGTYKSTSASVRAIAAYASITVEKATIEAAGLVGIAMSAENMTCNVTESVVKAGYAIANFADDNKLIINNSEVLGTGCGIYHNGTNKRFTLTVADSKIVAGTEEVDGAGNSQTTGIYVSGSVTEEADYSNITLTNCTVMGGTAIEGKFVNLTLTDCTVKATVSETSYVMNNNGATSLGFAVVITDNTKTTETTPAPKGTITITGDNGKYTGVVGLGNLASVKETYSDFVDASYAVSGGTFSAALGEEYCAEGFIPTENEDGTFGVKVGKYVAQYTNRSGELLKYEDIQEAINAASSFNGGQFVVEVLCDIEINETINYAKKNGGSVLLDLGGYTLTAKGCTAIQVHKGYFYIENGTITAVDIDENSAVIRVGSDNSDYSDTPKITIKGGAVISAPECYGILVYGSNTKREGITVGDKGVVEATGSKPAIAGKSDEAYNTGATTITVSGTAKVIASNNYAIYHPQAGTLSVYDTATVEGLGGIQMSAGTLKVSGSPVITSIDKAGNKAEVAGIVLDAAAISAVNRGFVGGAPVVIVTGTPVITANGEVITAYAWTNATETEWSDASITVSGGTYNKVFNDKYLAVRAYFEFKNGMYNVELEKVAEVNNVRYDSLQAAINAAVAGAGDTVKILQDFEVSNQITINGAITLDLNGKTITNTYGSENSSGMSINATVTIKNGTYIASSEVLYSGIYINKNKHLIIDNATIDAACKVGIELRYTNTKCTITGGSVVKADYAVASGADNASLKIENSQLVGTTCGIYHNGSNKNFTLIGNNATIIAGTEEVSETNNSTTGIYVSGSATSESEYSNITLTGCTVKGGTAIEGKFVNLTLIDCNVTATATETSYNANANGAATKGFAVALTDNTLSGTPAPAGTVEISGEDGVYSGIVGLGNLASFKETYADFVDASYAVSGGTFSSAIGDDYCAEGFIVSKNEQGTYSVKEGEYLVAIGEDKFGSLEDAVAVAKSGDTIKLLKDYTSDKEVSTRTVIDLTDITFDLNGFTFSANNFAYVFEGTDGVIKNGKMVSLNGGSYALFIGDSGKTTSFTVTGVELTGGINIYNATGVVLENLTVNGSNYYAVWLDYGAEATIKSGTYIAGSGVVFNAQTNNGNQSVLTIEGGTIDVGGKTLMGASGGKLLVKGGEFTNIGNLTSGDNNSIEVSGGTFSIAIDEKYCAAGFIPTENEDGTYGVKVGEYLVKIGEVKYDSLNAAVEAAKDGDTITLIKDVLLSEQVAIGKAITIDGAGYEIKATKYIASDKAGMFYRTTSARGTLTFKNVTLNGNGVSKIFINEGGAGETVFDTVVSTNGGGMQYGSGIHISGGGSHATIRNSTLTGSTGTTELNDENYYAANDLWVGGNVEVTVENSVIGTVFVNTTTAPATSVHGHLIVRGEETEIGYIAGENDVADKNGSLGSLTTIEGGSVDTIFDGGLYEISGGTFKTELKDEWLKDGFNVVENEDGTYGVKMVFYVASGYNGKVVAEFSSLDEAFAYAAENEYKFVVVSGTYVLTSDLIIPDGKFLDVTGTLTIAEGVTVTIPKTAKRLAAVLGGKIINNGTILLYGESNSGGYFMLNGGTLEGNPLTPPEGYVVDRNGSNFYVINISTAAVMVEYNDGTVRYFNENITTENAKKITLLRDFEGNFTISGTASVTYNVEIDLGGHTLSKSLSTDGGVILVSYANVVIKNGTVLSTATDGTSKPALKVNSHGNVTVADDVMLDGGTTQPAIYLEGGEVTLYGTATSKGGYAITTQGLNEHNTVITIKDGATVTAENGAAIYNPKGDLIIEGGAITGKIGVQICAGTLSISGNAQITATGAAEAHEGDGPVFDGSAVSIIDREGYAGLTSVEITGGTFISANGTAIRAFAYKDKTESAFDNSSKVVKVKGGSFSSIPDNMDELCADGYIVSKRGTSYSVIEGSYVAMIGDVKYGSIQAAFDKARSGDTVVLLSNIVLTGTQGTLYALVDGVIIDLNGYSIDGSSVSANAANPAAFGLNVEVGGSAGVITVKNSASAQSIITGVMPMKVLSTYSDPLKLVIEGDILLNATNGGNKVELDSGVYMVADDKAKAMIVNGGFLVTVSGEERIYGQLVSALKLGEVKLMNDYVAGTNLKIRSDWGDVVLNLNGKTYSFSGYGNCFEFANGAKLTIKNGKVASSNSAFSVPEGISNVELNVEDVEITAEDYAIVTNGTATNITVSVKNSVITSSDGVAIYFPSTGSLNIVDSEITGKVGVQVCAGTLAISGDKTVITGNGTIEAAGNGSVIDGSAVSIIKRTGYGDIASVTITGGKFVSVNGTAVKAYALDGTTESAFDNSAKIVAISGGTFSGEIEASLLKDGYKLIEVNGAYGVIEKLILGASVTLGEDISFNYYVKTKTDNTVVVVKYMKNGVMTEETLTEFVEYTAGGRYAGKYVFRGITPQMIGRDITIVYTDGEAHDIIENYSVADYLEKAYTNANNAQVTKQLAADVMYYGLAAMKYRKADEADIADIQSRITKLGMTQSNVEMTDTSVREGETIVYVSVRFDNANNLVFAVKDSVFEENPSYKYYIGKTEITEWNTTLIEGYHVYTCEALKAIEYVGKTFTVKVYRADEVLQTLTTDVGSYCARIAASQTYATELKELAKATYAYGTSASAYANRSNG